MPSHILSAPVIASPKSAVAERIALVSSIVLITQSAVLIAWPNDDALKLNLLAQTAALVSFGFFTWRCSGTLLSAPFLFASAIYLWHTTYLLGYYFELAEIFAFPGNAFSYGFQFIYQATAFVGL